ncbi:MAG: ABC transporter permease [Acetobacteraceae bacterium]|nr:ABC transporter permease [Acetobacteraceae bacterium]
MFWAYAARRAIHTAVTLALLLAFMYVLFRLIPGDPTTLLLGTGDLTPEAREHLRALWGLDQPQLQQFLTYARNLVTGDLGLSFYYRRPVLDVVWPMLLNTLVLMTPVVVLAITIGVALGTWLGWRRGDRVEEIGAVLALIPRALPVFWIGIVLMTLFAYQLRWFPISGMRQPFFYAETWWQRLPFFDLAQHLVLPVVAGVLASMADPLMIQRTALIEVRHEDFMLLARARGLSERAQRRLARRNALLPVLTYSAIMVGFAFGGQVLLEVVFTWPGMGRLMVNSVSQRDYPVAQATFFLMAAVVIALNLVVDLAYGWLDPRIRYE